MEKSLDIKTQKGFYIGDPCYAFDEGWGAIVDNFYDESKPNALTVDFNGYKLGMTNTAYGDGTYEGSNGTDYPVDAGMIGVTPLEVVEKDIERLRTLGTVIYWEGSATIAYNEGTIIISFYDSKDLDDIVIETDDDSDYEDEDYYEEDWLD